MRAAIAWTLLPWLLLPAASTADESPMLTLETLAEGVYAFRPTEESQTSWRAVSNSGAVVLDDGVLIYDSHWSPVQVQEAQRLLRTKTDKPIRYVIHSHFHLDHSGGAGVYGPEVEQISHHATRNRLVEQVAALPERLPRQIEGLERQLAAAESDADRLLAENILRSSRALKARIDAGDTGLSTLTFDRSLVFHRRPTLEVHFLGRGHTDGDAILYLPDEKVIFLGDLFWVRMLPNVSDGFTLEWIETLEAVLELDATRYVPGHGAVGDAEDVRELVGYLRWLRSAVEPFVKEGKGVEAAQAGVELPEVYADYLFQNHLAPGIAKVYGEIEAGR